MPVYSWVWPSSTCVVASSVVALYSEGPVPLTLLSSRPCHLSTSCLNSFKRSLNSSCIVNHAREHMTSSSSPIWGLFLWEQWICSLGENRSTTSTRIMVYCSVVDATSATASIRSHYISIRMAVKFAGLVVLRIYCILISKAWMAINNGKTILNSGDRVCPHAALQI